MNCTSRKSADLLAGPISCCHHSGTHSMRYNSEPAVPVASPCPSSPSLSSLARVVTTPPMRHSVAANLHPDQRAHTESRGQSSEKSSQCGRCTVDDARCVYVCYVCAPPASRAVCVRILTTAAVACSPPPIQLWARRVGSSLPGPMPLPVLARPRRPPPSPTHLVES